MSLDTGTQEVDYGEGWNLADIKNEKLRGL